MNGGQGHRRRTERTERGVLGEGVRTGMKGTLDTLASERENAADTLDRFTPAVRFEWGMPAPITDPEDLPPIELPGPGAWVVQGSGQAKFHTSAWDGLRLIQFRIQILNEGVANQRPMTGYVASHLGDTDVDTAPWLHTGLGLFDAATATSLRVAISCEVVDPLNVDGIETLEFVSAQYSAEGWRLL